MDNKKLGKLGEQAFESLCTHGCINVISSHANDVNGWDFFLEVPADIRADVSLDRQQTLIESKVQVKATETKSNGVDMKLSGLMKLVAVPYPVFFCFYVFNGGKDPEEGYLVHFDKELIIQVLRRVRKAHKDGKHDKLNKLYKKIKYDESNRIDLKDGNKLTNKIKDYVNNNYHKYLIEKQKLIHSPEYSSYFFKGSLFFKSKDEILQTFLGYKPDIPLSKAEEFEERWGVKLPKERGEISSATARISGGTEVKVLIDYASEKTLSFSAEWFSLPKLFSDELQIKASRIKMFFMDILIKNNELSFGSVDFVETEYLYEDLESALVVLGKISSGEKIKFRLLVEGETRAVTIFDTVLPLNNRSGEERLSEYLEVLRTAKNVWTYFGYEDIRHKPVKLSDLFYNAQRIIDINVLMQSEGKGVLIKIKPPYDLSLNARTVIVFSSFCYIMGEVFVLIVSLLFVNKEATIKDGSELIVDAVKEVEYQDVIHSSVFDSNIVDKEVRAIAKKYKSIGVENVDCFPKSI